MRKRGQTGDMVVARTKGKVGPNQRGWFRSIALYGIGSVSYGSAEDRGFFKQVEKLADYVDVYPLSEASRQQLQKLGVHVPPSDVVDMTVQDYTTRGTRAGRTLALAGREYITFEQGDDAVSLAWSSALPLLELLDKTFLPGHRSLQFTDGTAVIDDEMIAGTPEEILAEVGRCFDRVSFLRLDRADFALAWVANAEQAKTPRIRQHECFVISQGYEPDLFAHIIEGSATMDIGHSAAKLVGEFSDLGRDYVSER